MALGAWLHQQAILSGMTSDSPEEALSNKEASEEFESALEKLYNLCDNDHFNMSLNVQSILNRMYWRLGKYRLRNIENQAPIESPLNIISDASERFLHASLSDLHLLTWRERVLPITNKFLRWLEPLILKVVHWLFSVVLVIWFGSKKGRRLSDEILPF